MADVRVPLEDWGTLKLKALFFLPCYLAFSEHLTAEQRRELPELSKKLASTAGGEKLDSISNPSERQIRTLQPVTYKKAKAAIALMNHYGHNSTEDDIIFGGFHFPKLKTLLGNDSNKIKDLINHLDVSEHFLTQLTSSRRTIFTIGVQIFDFLGCANNDISLAQFMTTSVRNRIFEVAKDANGDSELSSQHLVLAPKTGHQRSFDGPYAQSGSYANAP